MTDPPSQSQLPSHMPGDPVLPLAAGAEPRAVEVLTLAFLEDPIYRTLIADPADRRHSLEALWRALIRTCRRYGVVDSTPEIAGVACWLAPGHADLGLWPMLRTGLALPRAMLQFPADGRKRFLEMVAVSDRIRREKMPLPHWYLWALGVNPVLQGQGIGRALLAHGLARADESRLPCYLETETEANVAFYTRRDFEVVHEGEVVGLRLWSMLRRPRGPQASAPP